MKKYYVFGLPRSGTNLLDRSVNNNYKCNIENPCINFHNLWKHSLISSDHIQDDHVAFVVYKHIYTWLESILIRSPYDAQLMYRAAQQQKPELYEKISNIDSVYWFSNYTTCLEGVIEIYQEFLKQFLDKSNIRFVEYEKLLIEDSYESILKGCGEFLEKTQIAPKILSLPPKVSVSEKYNSVWNNYYINKKPIFLPPEIIEIVDEKFDFDLYTKFDKLSIK